MADPSAVQNLCDALKAAFALPLATEYNLYTFAKDFQIFFAAIIAGFTATGAAVVAYRAAKLTYRGVTDQIKERADVAARDRDQRRFGAYRRLRSELWTLEMEASSQAEDLQNKLNDLDAKVPIPKVGKEADHTEMALFLDAEEARIVTWRPLEFPKVDELDIAWSNIELYPDKAIRLIDDLRRGLQKAKAFPDTEWVRALVKDGKIGYLPADLYRSEIAVVANLSEGLKRILDDEVHALEKALNIDQAPQS